MGSKGEGRRSPRQLAASAGACVPFLFGILGGAVSAAEPASPRFEIRQPTIEAEPDAEAERARGSRYTVRAALREDPDPAPRSPRYSLKATVGGDDVATACAPTNDIFANGFE